MSRRSSRAKQALGIGIVGLVWAHAAAAGTSSYVEVGLGAHAAPPLAAHGADNDWSTKCDLIINPGGLETGGECDAPPPPTSWTNEFDRGSGTAAGVAIGHDWGSLRLEVELSHRNTAYDDRSDTGIFDDVTADKREQEIEQAYGEIDDLRSHGAFVNAYYDFAPWQARWTPYIGLGLGGTRATLDYRSVWKRNDDPDRISTFVDPTLRAKLAGTTTIGDKRLTATSVGYQLLAGIDYQLDNHTSLGIKLRWVDFGEFESDETLWSQLRSHDSTVGRGESIRYAITTNDNRFWSLGISMKRRF